MARRNVDIHYSLTEKKIISDSLEPYSDGSTPSISYKEEVLFRLYLYNLSDTGYIAVTDFDSTDAYSVAADDDYDAVSPVWLRTPNSEINQVADWAAVDPANGKFCFVIDANSNDLNTALGTLSSIEGVVEMQILAGGLGYVIGAFSFPAIFTNLIDSVAYTTIDPANYSDTALNATTIQMLLDFTSSIQVGAIIGVDISGTWAYGYATSVTAGTLVVSGITLTLGAGDIQGLKFEQLPPNVGSLFYQKIEVDALVADKATYEAAVKYAMAYS